jgi:hypothetical protein
MGLDFAELSDDQRLHALRVCADTAAFMHDAAMAFGYTMTTVSTNFIGAIKDKEGSADIQSAAEAMAKDHGLVSASYFQSIRNMVAHMIPTLRGIVELPPAGTTKQ